ncbi:hypothetical protein Psta_3364 [Pirellula staleyi DSM 6068]|uniref:Uncharacterized protein n=1 Tax=Pirellula staleyi (strain ATCC 27377 / DSM 6068 / ICPB 4128) TaxID=530564 RepID=D2QXV1_PIRSD|nr:DUF6717 family protein [Pirellula staleyi]ADB18028.1 hypothetical protein Psta_3364 [Pirellula staleyi DSM 6068]
MNTQPSAVGAETSRPTINWRRLAIITALLLAVAAGVTWQYVIVPARGPALRENAIMVIAPYRHQGTWVFDDASAGLVKEPFVAGVPEMIDVLVEEIPTADQGFRLLFSAQPFPGHQKKLTWLRGDSGGNYYAVDEPPMEGWICPALFKYYASAPKNLYVKAEPIH